MSFLDQDFDYIPEDQAEVILPPLIQWRRGDLQSEDKRLNKGCFQLPIERYTIEGQEPVDVQHISSVVPSYLFGKLHVAVLGWRKDWFVGRGENRRRQTSYDPNVTAWSRIQAWVYVKELAGQFMLTFNSSNSIGFEDALNQFRSTVIGPAGQKAKVTFPLYAFWMPIGPGEKKTFKKQGTYATPPAIYLRPPISDETLEKLFVGKENVEQFKGLWPQVNEWATRKFGEDDDVQDEEESFADNGSQPPPRVQAEPEWPEPQQNGPPALSEGEIPF